VPLVLIHGCDSRNSYQDYYDEVRTSNLEEEEEEEEKSTKKWTNTTKQAKNVQRRNSTQKWENTTK
jgi:hypothetical protein